MSKFHVTAIVNAHKEGLWLKPALDSVWACFEVARERGLTTELLVAMDRADALSVEIVIDCVARFPHVRVVPMNHGDVGHARNEAASLAEGEYVAFLDGDDLWGTTWIADAFAMASADERELVLHPEVNVYFGYDPHVFVHVDAEAKNFDAAALGLVNYWTSLCFVRREFLIENPYPETDLVAQIGYEDWAWNLKAMSAAAVHKIVPGTGHAIRMKKISLVRQTSSAGCIAAPSDIFRKIINSQIKISNSRIRIAA